MLARGGFELTSKPYLERAPFPCVFVLTDIYKNLEKSGLSAIFYPQHHWITISDQLDNKTDFSYVIACDRWHTNNIVLSCFRTPERGEP